MIPVTAQPQRRLPFRRSIAVWLSVFFSPTAYFLLLMIADRFHISAPPDALVSFLFYFVPIVALFVCGTVVWLSTQTVRARIGWLVFTLFAMAVQFGVILAIIIEAPGYVQ